MLRKFAIPSAALCLMMAAASPSPLYAQSGTSSALAGTVTDQSGAMIPAADVKATELNSGAVRDLQTNADGRFLFSQLNPGTYRIEVRATGFAVAA